MCRTADGGRAVDDVFVKEADDDVYCGEEGVGVEQEGEYVGRGVAFLVVVVELQLTLAVAIFISSE